MTLQDALQQIVDEYKRTSEQQQSTIETAQSTIQNGSGALIPMRLNKLLSSAPEALASFFDIDLEEGSIRLKTQFNGTRFIAPILNATLNIPSQKDLWSTLWNANAFSNCFDHADSIPANHFNKDVQPSLLRQFKTTTHLTVQGEPFQMGAVLGDGLAWDDEKGGATLPMPFNFEVCIYPVTQLEWFMIMQGQPSHHKNFSAPVENISWFQALEFCNRLSELNGFEPVYNIPSSNLIKSDFTLAHKNTQQNLNANGWRLPLEIEWEFAAKAGQSFVFSGSDDIDTVAWYGPREWKDDKWQNVGGGNCETSHPVGQKEPNDFGIYDMSGNVWEWCWNVFGTLPQHSDEVVSYSDQSKGCRMIKKGGGWLYVPKSCRISNRGWQKPNSQHQMGMRLFRTLP